MTNEFWWILPAGVLWIPVLAWLLRGFGRLRPAASWMAGWSCLWLAGLFVSSGEHTESGVLYAAARVVGMMFGAFMLAGTYSFSRDPVPAWLAGGAAVVALALGGLSYVGNPEAAWLSAVAGAAFLGFGAYRLITMYTLNADAGSAERAIGPLFLLLMALELVDGDAATGQTVGAWLAVGGITAFAMVLTVGERARRSEQLGQAALRVEQGVLAGMTEAVPIGILLSDPAGRIVRINEHLREQFQLEEPAEAWAGRAAWDLMVAVQPDLAPQDSDEINRYAARLAEDRRKPLAGQEVRFKNGNVLMLSAHPVHGSDGGHLGRVWVCRDVTDEYRVADRIQHSERMETLGTLAGGLAHDFNNQLTAILGNAAMLRDSAGLTPDERRMLTDLEGAAQHCADLTRGLLTFARREPGEPRSLDLEPVIDGIEALLRPSIPRTTTLQVELPPGLPPILADEVQFQRVLTNLIVNARDAMDGEGVISLTASEVEGGVEIVVSDAGCGMSEDVRRQMFDPFFTTKPVGEGTGLGLAIVYGIVDAHGGRVEVESAPDDGTSFSVVWPLATEPCEEPAVAPQIPHAARVLLAEDDPSVRRLVRRGLERAGFTVTAVEGGQEAIDVFEAQPDAFDIAVFDYKMPGATGLQALQRIRELSPGIPALVVSGHPEGAGEEGWPEDVPLLMKPFDPRRLAERIATVLAAEPRV